MTISDLHILQLSSNMLGEYALRSPIHTDKFQLGYNSSDFEDFYETGQLVKSPHPNSSIS